MTVSSLLEAAEAILALQPAASTSNALTQVPA
jgi:hypothetical protein